MAWWWDEEPADEWEPFYEQAMGSHRSV
jgi:hypothetical protein